MKDFKMLNDLLKLMAYVDVTWKLIFINDLHAKFHNALDCNMAVYSLVTILEFLKKSYNTTKKAKY